MHTRQSAFDAALRGVRAQGYQCAIYQGSCAYMVGDNHKFRCGVGHMLSEDVARQAECSVGAILRGHGVGDWRLKFKGEPFLTACQAAHDHMFDAKSFEHHMREIARDYDLTYTPPEVQP